MEGMNGAQRALVLVALLGFLALIMGVAAFANI
jgi:hypothetical protein